MSAATAPALGATVRDLLTTAARPLSIALETSCRLSVVVPTLNEAPNIVRFLGALHAALSGVRSFEIIVIDDDSPDDTAAQAARARLPNVRVFRRRFERGLASAVIRGWQVSGGELLATVNADFQHPPDLLPAMLARAADADLVLASRYCPGGNCGDWGFSRQLTAHAARLAGRLVVPEIFSRVSDPLTGCYLVRRAAIAGIQFQPCGFKSLIEILARAPGLRIAECGYSFRSRQAGRSKASLTQAGRYLVHLNRLRRACR